MEYDFAKEFQFQAYACRALGSPFTAALMEACLADIEEVAALFPPEAVWRRSDVLPLRFAGALHAAVLSAKAPDLAARYPAPGRSWRMDEVWPAARRFIAQNEEWVRAFLFSPPQTNETRRAMALAPAFLQLARHNAPLHLRELGASAGLLLNWDRFYYRTRTWRFGEERADAPVIDTDWRGAPPTLSARPVIASRKGCDLNPLNIAAEEGRLRLKAFIWPDQFERLERLDRAIAIAAQSDGFVDRAEAGAWVETTLGGPLLEGITVIYHSIAWQYFPEETRQRIYAAIEAAGARATPARRLAWVRFESARELGHDDDGFIVDLREWPGKAAFGALLRADAHLNWVEPVG